MEAKFARSTLWQVLAQAFLPPTDREVAAAFVDGLADDLTELAQPLGLDIAGELAAFSAAAAAFGAPDALLVEYSRIFLPPHALATLNLSRYVDDSINGPCMDALELAYARIGLAPGDRLRDLPDHATIQFECLAYLAGEKDEAQEGQFARLCLVGALHRLARVLADAAPESPYTALVRIAAKAIERHAIPADAGTTRSQRRHDTALGVWRHCGNCDKPFAREKEIRIIARALKEAGLPDDHLGLCPDCRDTARGYFKRMAG